MIFLSKETELHFEFCGFFEAPSSDWVHLSRELREYELMIVTEGTLYISSVEGSPVKDSSVSAASPAKVTEHVVPAGHYLLMPPTPHQFGSRPSFCKFYWFHFEHQRTERGFGLPLSGICPNPERLQPLISNLQEADRTYHNEPLNAALLRALLLELYLQQPSSAPEKEVKNHYTRLCEDIRHYIEWNYFSNIKVRDIAAYFGYHEKYLSTVFRKETGTGLKEYLLEVKMKYACQALARTDISISRLALNLGFSDAHNFSNAFRKVTGCSPTAYRIQHREKEPT